MSNWIDACWVDDVEPEDVLAFDHDNRVFAIIRSPEGDFFCTDGICTHEHALMPDGMVFDHLIECPKHNGQFDYRTGHAMRSPACKDLQTYPVKVEGGRVFVFI